MKGTDKFLLGIVAGVVLLVAVTFVLVLRRPEPTYRSEETPEGVAHNYLLALRQGEYDRAYGYLSPTLVDYPTNAEQFAGQVEDTRWAFRLDRDVSLVVESARISGDRATAVVQETTFYTGGLFSSNQSISTFDMILMRQDDTWKIIDADRYWRSCWTRSSGC
jgi:hypothetical protein